MQEKEVFLKNKNNILLVLKIIFFFLIIILNNSIKANQNIGLLKNEIEKYLSEINDFSSSFIQYSDNSFQEGNFFLKKNRLRVEYTSPSNIILIIKENKAMYYNVDLEEVEYFNPKKTAASIFFNFFYNKEFLNDANIELKKNNLYIFQKILINKKENTVTVLFEKSPIKLRKIEIKNFEGLTSFTIINPNYNPNLDDKMFSLAHPLLN